MHIGLPTRSAIDQRRVVGSGGGLLGQWEGRWASGRVVGPVGGLLGQWEGWRRVAVQSAQDPVPPTVHPHCRVSLTQQPRPHIHTAWVSLTQQPRPHIHTAWVSLTQQPRPHCRVSLTQQPRPHTHTAGCPSPTQTRRLNREVLCMSPRCVYEPVHITCCIRHPYRLVRFEESETLDLCCKIDTRGI